MIAYVKGILVDIEENKVIVESSNIGYGIFTPGGAAALPGIGSEVKLYTYLNVREDAMQLYGFLTKDDLQFFKLLIGVNGVGPKAALGILSALSADDLRFAILADDVGKIISAPGIGKKTAGKIVLELKDKLDLQDSFEKRLAGSQEAVSDHGMGDRRNEAVLALAALGYSNADALGAVNKVELSVEITVEEILKQALKYLTTG